jgi:hypothetical protein
MSTKQPNNCINETLSYLPLQVLQSHSLIPASCSIFASWCSQYSIS